jgi:hypothetical protein
MAFILYSPVTAGVPVHVGGGHHFCFPAGEDEGHCPKVSGFL